MGREAEESGEKKWTSEDGDESLWPIGEEDDAVGAASHGGKGTWKHAAFHVATTIATPAAYAPLPFALASLGWPLGYELQPHPRARPGKLEGCPCLAAELINYDKRVASLGNNIAIQIAAGSSLKGSPTTKILNAFNALGAIAFSFGDAMLPEIQNTVREPAKKNMYKGVSAAYMVIVLSYWQLAFSGYWAFGLSVQPYIVSSLTNPKWTIVIANIFAVIQISGCFQIYCRPTYAYVEERMAFKSGSRLHNVLKRLILTSIYMVLISLVATAMPFFGDFVSICGAVGFTPLDFVFPALAFLEAGKLSKKTRRRVLVQILNTGIATWFSIVAILGCIGAVRLITKDVKTYKFFHDM
ncbi:hypothetical protein ACLOJK_027071 [Asimina triloba]